MPGSLKAQKHALINIIVPHYVYPQHLQLFLYSCCPGASDFVPQDLCSGRGGHTLLVLARKKGERHRRSHLASRAKRQFLVGKIKKGLEDQGSIPRRGSKKPPEGQGTSPRRSKRLPKKPDTTSKKSGSDNKVPPRYKSFTGGCGSSWHGSSNVSVRPVPMSSRSKNRNLR